MWKKTFSQQEILFLIFLGMYSHTSESSHPLCNNILWSVFVKPVLRSGLAALPIRPPVLKTLTTFHHKVLRAILKFSQYSPVAPLYFLLGELPIEASLHLDILALFWNI